MIAILGGLGAAVAWAGSTLCSSRSARMIPPASVVAWIAIVGLLITAPLVGAAGIPARLDAGAAGWLLLSGAGNLIGLLVAYMAYREGDVALIAPVISTEGAIAAVIALAFGESIGAATAATLAVIAIGVALAALPAGAPRASAGGRASRVVLYAGVAAVSFGASLYATGRAGAELPIAWVLVPFRVLGTMLLALPLALSGRLALTRRSAPLVLAAGVLEVLGFASFTLGARHDLAVAAVLSCQFAAIAAVAAYFLFRERLQRTQLAGVVVVLTGVSLLSGLHG
jgi:drug/metabolite transporter (DMT)-like permease